MMSKTPRSGLIRTGIFLAVATALAPIASHAQTAGEQTGSSATELDAVQVHSAYIPEPMLKTAEVASFITREDFARTGDSDAAQALARVGGLSLVNDKFVYVRGLGERYSSALFNGSPVPSPEPLQRVVPLDLFPSEVLEGVTVQKTYSANYPGEFGGGVIDLQGLTVPDQPFLSVTVGMGGNSRTTGDPGLTYYGGDDDWWGYDDGTRKLFRGLSDKAENQRVELGNYSREEIRTFGRSINDPNLYLLQQKDDIDPDFNFGGSAGTSLELDENLRLGVVAVANFENEWRTREGKQQDGFFTGDQVTYNNSYDFVSTRNNARVNAMLGLGLESERHKIGWTTLYVHDTQKEARSRAGLDNLAGFEARDDYTSWFERQMVSNQLMGSHTFGDYNDLKIEWRGAVARARRLSPYETWVGYENVDGYWSHDGSRVQNYFRFGRVDDRITSGGVDATWRLPIDRELTLSGGLAYSDNDRSAQQREFRFLALDGAMPFYNRYQRVDYLFSDYNLSQDLLRIRETTGNSGAAAYDATLKVKAAYLQVEGEIMPLVRGNFGVRWEDATQAVRPYDIFTGVPTDDIAPLVGDNLLPAATVTWNFADNQQIRFGVSETLARPQFREMAPQQYTNPDNDRLYYGNPHLTDSKLRNFDARYEWFYGAGEYFTAGLFYKQIDKPIEANVNEAGATTFQSFFNAPEATVYGFEVDFKRYFDLPIDARWWGDNKLYLATNYTWSDSEVNADAGDVVQPYGYPGPVPALEFVKDGSRLQGQSEHIANLQVGIESDSSKLKATLIANYVSERISARGRPGQPDYLEDPGTTLDFVVRKGLADWGMFTPSLSFSARNLLDTKYQEYQESAGNRIDIYTYKPGVSWDVSLTLAF